MPDSTPTDKQATPPPEPTGPGSQPTIRSEDLLQGGREVLIRHGSEIYRLRITKAGKLILNK